MTTKMTNKAVDKFFDNEEVAEHFEDKLKSHMKNYVDELTNDYAWFLKDEFQNWFLELLNREVEDAVNKLLLGDDSVFKKYNLQFSDWGFPIDHKGIRKKLMDDFGDVIVKTEIQELREEIKWLQEQSQYARER